MYGLVNNYPTTNFHEINLDYIIKLVRENNGLHLDVSGNQLLLKTLDGTTVSSVTVHYAETAGHADTATSATNATYATTASTASTATAQRLGTRTPMARRPRLRPSSFHLRRIYAPHSRLPGSPPPRHRHRTPRRRSTSTLPSRPLPLLASSRRLLDSPRRHCPLPSP